MIWILMGMLILGLGGFGVTNLGGTLRSIGSVEDKDIDINAYARALQNEINAIQTQTGQTLSFAQAQAYGVDRSLLARLVTSRALDAEAARLGLSLGDEMLSRQLVDISAFQGLDGSFDRDAYRFALDNAGLSESQFEADIREETARTLLQGAIMGGIAESDVYADAILSYLAERRSFEWVSLTASDLDTPIGAVTDTQLQTYYDENIAAYMRPATREISYIWLSPDMLIDSVDVDEDSLKELFASRISEFEQPERRLIERLAFLDSAEADAARARLSNGEISFDALVQERGLSLSDVDMGDVAASELGQAAQMVFEANPGAVVGPAPSDLGPAIFRVNGILPAKSVSFEEARPALREELAATRARREIDAQINDVDDLLAAGATLEEIADETEMQLASVVWHAGVSDGIAGYDAFRATASAVTPEDFPEIEQLSDGGIFAIRLEGDTAASPSPLEDIKDTVTADWARVETVKALQVKASALVGRLQETADFVSLGLTPQQESELIRSSFVADAPQALIQTVFAMDTAEVQAVEGNTNVIIVKLTEILAPDYSNPEIETTRDAVKQQYVAGVAQDVFDAYTRALQSGMDIQLNQQAINAVHANFQ
jgi:peptidyl-prolyl cis-trans isomerase D